MNEFAHGKGDTNFMNMAFNVNPLVAFTVPYSTLGTGLVVLPTKDPKEAVITLFLMSATGNPTNSGFGDLNDDNLLVAAEGRVRTNFFGFTGISFSARLFPTKSLLQSIRGWTGTRSRTARSGLRKVPGTCSTTLTNICMSPKRAWTVEWVCSDGSGFPTAIRTS